MTIMTTNDRFSLLLVSFLLGTGANADTVELGSITIEGNTTKENSGELSYTDTQKTETMAQNASGETLGDYLSSQMGVESATYGSAVGRPVVRGMEGYRVGISQGGIMLNDLSAMSQDHAVGLNARIAERIEMVKGPASLLYGSYSGGVIRTLGEEHVAALAKKGLSFDTSLSTNSDTGFGMGSVKSSYASDAYAVYLDYYRNEASEYHSGGEFVPNSDTFSEQLHGVLGWKINDNHTVKLYTDNLEKEYGIPNTTPERTDIVMEQQRYGVVLHSKSLGMLKNVVTEYQMSDYLHYERDDGENDGLFGQMQHSVSSKFDIEMGEETEANFRVEFMNNALKVCHEHGNCDDFSTAIRTGSEDGLSLLNYYNSTGIPFSHGHPMPNTEEQKLLLGFNLKYYYGEADEFSIASNVVLRRLTPDPANMQETWLMHESLDPDYYDKVEDAAVSLSLGWWHVWSDTLTSQVSLAYMERLPSAQELFWNGFHHATESYILGNRDLDKERSVNLDMDVLWKHNKNFSSRLSLYYYDFENYIYQSPVVNSNGDPILDPFHSSPVWQMLGIGANIYGMGVEESYTKTLGAHTLTAQFQLNLLTGELDSGGYIPRMSPYNATVSLRHEHMGFDSRLSFKWVDKSRNVAENETETDGYTILNFSTRYTYALTDGSLEFWLKGQNLTDEVARNHLSFLKESAPLPGRAVIVGVRYQY